MWNLSAVLKVLPFRDILKRRIWERRVCTYTNRQGCGAHCSERTGKIYRSSVFAFYMTSQKVPEWLCVLQKVLHSSHHTCDPIASTDVPSHSKDEQAPHRLYAHSLVLSFFTFLSVLCVRFIFCYICSLRYAQGRNGHLEAPLTRARRDSRHKYLAQLLLALWQGEPNNSRPTGNNGARNEETRCNWGSKGQLSEAQGFRALKNTTTICTLEIMLCKSIIMAIDNTISWILQTLLWMSTSVSMFSA